MWELRLSTSYLRLEPWLVGGMEGGSVSLRLPGRSLGVGSLGSGGVPWRGRGNSTSDIEGP